MADDHRWGDWFASWSDSGRFAHPDSPAGGSGPGYARPPGPLGLGDDWPLFSPVPHPDSPAGRYFVWQLELPRLVIEQRAKAIYDAVTLAPRYVPRALYEATGQELDSMVSGIIPGLLMFLGVLAGSTAFGALAGAAIGSLAFGVGAAPGAAVGGELGFSAGTALLNYLGLTVLVAYIGKSLLDAATVAGDAVQIAWHSVDNGRTQQLAIDHAADRLAFALGLVFRGVLQGIVQFLLAKGTAAAASRVPELVSELRQSKLGGAFAAWVERNWQSLLKNPKLRPAKGTGPGGAVGEGQGAAAGTVNGTGAASGSSGARAAGAREGVRTDPSQVPKKPQNVPKKRVGPKEPVASLLENAEFNGIKADRVRPGTNDEVAVIGRSMDGAVNPYAKGLQAAGYDAETFQGSSIARDQWSQLIKDYAPEKVPDNVVRQSLIYQENEAWAQKLANQGSTVVDVDNPTKQGDSPFYEMEKNVLFGHGGGN